jgi:hypothetical protein
MYSCYLKIEPFTIHILKLITNIDYSFELAWKMYILLESCVKANM